MSAQTAAGQRSEADMILMNGRIATRDERGSFASAVAIKDGRFFAVGTEREVMLSPRGWHRRDRCGRPDGHPRPQ